MATEVAIRNLLLEATTLFSSGKRSAARYSISRKGYDTGAVSRSVLLILQDHRGNPTVEAEEAQCIIRMRRHVFQPRRKIRSRPKRSPKGVSTLARYVVLHCAPSGPPKVSPNSSLKPFGWEVPQVPGARVVRQNARSFEAKALSASAKGHWRDVLCCDLHLQSH